MKRCFNSKKKIRAKWCKSLTGFTLIEIMVTVAILSLGIVFIYEGFFTSLGAYGYCQNYLQVQNWIDKKNWNIQDSLRRNHTLFTQKPKGEFKIKGKYFNWQLDYAIIEGSEKINLYEILLKVEWREGKRNIKLVRATYLRDLKDIKDNWLVGSSQ